MASLRHADDITDFDAKYEQVKRSKQRDLVPPSLLKPLSCGTGSESPTSFTQETKTRVKVQNGLGLGNRGTEATAPAEKLALQAPHEDEGQAHFLDSSFSGRPASSSESADTSDEPEDEPEDKPVQDVHQPNTPIEDVFGQPHRELVDAPQYRFPVCDAVSISKTKPHSLSPLQMKQNMQSVPVTPPRVLVSPPVSNAADTSAISPHLLQMVLPLVESDEPVQDRHQPNTPIEDVLGQRHREFVDAPQYRFPVCDVVDSKTKPQSLSPLQMTKNMQFVPVTPRRTLASPPVSSPAISNDTNGHEKGTQVTAPTSNVALKRDFTDEEAKEKFLQAMAAMFSTADTPEKEHILQPNSNYQREPVCSTNAQRNSNRLISPLASAKVHKINEKPSIQRFDNIDKKPSNSLRTASPPPPEEAVQIEVGPASGKRLVTVKLGSSSSSISPSSKRQKSQRKKRHHDHHHDHRRRSHRKSSKSRKKHKKKAKPKTGKGKKQKKTGKKQTKKKQSDKSKGKKQTKRHLKN